MSTAIDGRNDDPRYATRGAGYVPAGGGPTRWFSGTFFEGGDEPQRGVQVQPWGPERFDDRVLGLFAEYGTEALPDE